MKNFFSVLWPIVIFLCSSCSMAPSDNDIEKAVLGKGDARWQKIAHLIRYDNFKVLNKYQMENFWVAKIKYDIIFKDELDNVVAEMVKMDQSSPIATMQALLFKQTMLSMCGKIKKNLPCSIEREVKLVKSDKGWIVPSQ